MAVIDLSGRKEQVQEIKKIILSAQILDQVPLALNERIGAGEYPNGEIFEARYGHEKYIAVENKTTKKSALFKLEDILQALAECVETKE